MQNNRRMWLACGVGILALAGLVYAIWPSGQSGYDLLKSSDPNKRIEGIIKLHTDGSDKAIRAIATLITDPETEVACRAVHAVSISTLKERGNLVRQAMTDQRPAVRAAALAGLGACGEKTDEQALVESLSSPDPAVRAGAAQALGHLLAYDSLPALVTALDDPDQGVREQAGSAVLQLFSNRDVGYRADDPPEVRAQAVQRIREWMPSMQEAKPALRSRVRRSR